MNIQLHIEALVFHGFAALDRQAINAAVEQELGRLLAAQGVPPALAVGRAMARLDGGSFTVRPDAKPAHIGLQVAQAIYGGFQR
jgi:hypothetical protein